MSWLENQQQSSNEDAIVVLKQIQTKTDQRTTTTGHFGPLFGLMGGYLGIGADETCQIMGYCAARDMVSAAVRLNLLGPTAGVTVLDGAFGAVREGVEAAARSSASLEESSGGLVDCD